MNDTPTVFVGLSGGVDSAVAAARLKARGYNVVGVFIKVWHPEFMVCNWEAERLDAMRIAAKLDIPFLTCDAEAVYRDEVANYFITEYQAGRTPNPDVMCNKSVKFGAFLQFAEEKRADFIATGHYVRRVDRENGPELHRGIDNNKDQSYFLWALSDKQLAKSLFPVGDTDKTAIRQEAELYAIPVAEKKDSQGVCFLGHVDIPDFLSHYVDLRTGPVVNEFGQIIGEHKGALVYTIGQRHGFNLNISDPHRTPMFVIAKDIETNTLVVSATKKSVAVDENIILSHQVLRHPIVVGDRLEAQTRYRQTPFVVEVVDIDKHKIVIKPKSIVETPAKGQSCVLYNESLCLGGGIID